MDHRLHADDIVIDRSRPCHTVLPHRRRLRSQLRARPRSRLRREVDLVDFAAVTQYSPYVWKSLTSLSARDPTYVSAGVRLKIRRPHTSPPITGAPNSIWDVHHQVPKSPRKSFTPSCHPMVTHHQRPGDASTFASESWLSFEDGKYKHTGQREVIPLLIITALLMNPFPLRRLLRAVD